MSGHRAPDQPLVRLSFRGRLVLASAILGALSLAMGGVALGAALGGGQVTCSPGVDLLVHPDGTWTCGQPAPSGSPTPTPSATQTPSPSPSPTVQPSPSVTPTATTPPATTPPATTPPPPGPLTNCLAAPAKCGLPDASTTGPTGVLAVTTKKVYSTAGQVITNTQINGCVEIRAAGVTFRNVLFNGSGCMFPVRNYGGGAVLEDVEMTCGNQPGSSGFVNTGTGMVTLRRADIHACENGLSSGIGSITLVDSWIHDLVTCCGAHTDGAQFDQGAANINFSHNVIDTRGNTSSSVTMWDEGDPQNSNVTFDRNFFMGGAISLRCGRQGAIVNVVITNNRFIGGVWVNGNFVPDPGGPTYDTSNSCNRGQLWSGNVRDLTGAALAAD